MPKMRYINKRFRNDALDTIASANAIIAEYNAQGLQLTLRQLYYQFVSRALIPNTEKSYKNLGSIINDGRLAGLIDWNAVYDRTRNLRSNPHWSGPADIVKSAANGFAIDKWSTQPFRVEVWIEKEALAGVIEGICDQLDVPWFACRGYTSQSEMWAAAMRLQRYSRGYTVERVNGSMQQRSKERQTPYIIHLGDHDPSGIDMTRDIKDRLEMFMGGMRVERLALNLDQVEQYNPPPNPAKMTDSRFGAYLAEFGDESWELDALEPTVIRDLIERAVLDVRDEDAWQAALDRENDERQLLKRTSDRWLEVAEFVDAL